MRCVYVHVFSSVAPRLLLSAIIGGSPDVAHQMTEGHPTLKEALDQPPIPLSDTMTAGIASFISICVMLSESYTPLHTAYTVLFVYLSFI